MSSGAELKGADEILKRLESKLGDAKIKRIANRSLKDTAKEMEVTFKEAVSVYKRTGETVSSVTSGGVSNASGMPKIKLGFGAGSRWRLVHLNEFGYAKNHHPRGFGVIRRYYESNKQTYKIKMSEKIRSALKW